MRPLKIAIVAPSPVPYMVGGAEKLWWGLLRALNQLTRHEAELIKVPSPERTLWELLASYRRFSALDLSHFDLVISTKYPAWMIRHPNHHVYLQHKMRCVYDTYHRYEIAPLPTALPKPLDALLRLTEKRAPNVDDLDRFWELTDQCRQRLGDKEKWASLFRIPGPVARQVVHFLDRIAFLPGAVRRFTAISENVVRRQDYFPAGTPVEVIHHPSDLAGFHSTGYDYLFTLSRLEEIKRIHWLVEAFMATRVDREFRIAGTGSDEQRLRELSKGDPRIKILGRITDDEVIRQYAGALFVPFAPLDEDYGLITIEAMQSGKPVLTCRDAGGVCEFVKNGVTGLSVKPDKQALSHAMALMSEDEPWMRDMGRNAQEAVKHISWAETLERLIPDD